MKPQQSWKWMLPTTAGMLLFSFSLLGQTPAPMKTPGTTPPPEKTIVFEMRGKPWSKVFEWLSDQTGLPVISDHTPPQGAFDFTAPRINGEPRKYTIAEVIDVINEGLLNKKWVLLRRDAALTLVPADEKIDPALVPQVPLDDLPKRGRTEIVKTMVPLHTLVAEDFAPEVKKMMGPFGEVVVLSKANQLMLQEKVATLREIIKTIRDSEDLEKGQAETFSHKCVYIRASAAEQLLRNFLGDPRQVIETTTKSPMGPFSGRDNPPPQVKTKIRMHYITSDDRTNTVHVNGPPDKIAQAKAVMAKLDVPQPGQPPIALGPPQLTTYPVPSGNADALARTLQEIYKSTPSLRISAVGNNQIMVWAGPEDQIEIARHIQGAKPAASSAELIPLAAADAAKMVEMLKGMYGDPKAGAPYIEADPIRNAVVVKGSAEQVQEVKAVLQIIGDNSSPQAGNLRIFSLEKGSAATLAEALERLVPQMRNNPVKVILPGQEEKNKPAPHPFDRDSKLYTPGKGALDQPQPVSFQAGQQLIDPQKEKSEKPGKKEAPVTITAFGNKLIVTSEDPQALALVGELVRLMTQTQAGEGDFEVVRLKNANAVEAARILDEAFNGPKPGQNQGRSSGSSTGGGGFPLPFGGGGLSSLFGGGSGGAASPRVERIRVVADPATNSLLIKATPLDMLTIRNLVTRAIDINENDSRAVIRTWVIGPLKAANANEVAGILREVFRENMNNNPQGSRTPGGFSGFGVFGGFGSTSRPQTLNIDANGNPRGVTLSVGVDDKTNSLILACPQPLYEDIKKLVEQLEKAAADSPQVVRVVSIKGIDPQLVQQALDAIQGRTSQQPRRDFNNNNQGSSGFNPFGTGGIIRPPFGGGGFQGGTGIPSGGSGGGGSGRPGFRRPGGSSGPQSRGPDFFVPTVMDDHPVLFDPNTDEIVQRSTQPEIRPVSFQEPQQPGGKEPPAKEPPAKEPGKEPAKDQVGSPRLPVTAEALEELGVLVLRANNPADLEAALRIIEFIQRLGSGAEVDIQLVPLKHADPVSVTNTLNLLFQRVQIGPNATILTPANTQQGRPTFGTPQLTPGQTAAPAAPTATPSGSVVLIPLTRLNAILMATPKARSADILREIERLDLPTAAESRARAFPLKRASASRVAILLNNFYSDRFPNEARTQNQVRVTFEEGTNTVFVQAAPADLADIADLIGRIDNTVSSATNDLKIIPLRNAVADDLANLLLRSLSEGIGATGTAGAGFQGGGGGQLGQPGGVGLSGFGQTGGLGQAGGLPGQTSQLRPGQTKISSLRFLVKAKEGTKLLEAGIFEDIRINSDPRTNSLLIAAPEKTMELLLAVIRELDMPPQARSEINIFNLKKADAAQTALTLQQLFLGSGSAGVPRTTTGTTGLPGVPGGQGTLGGIPGGTGLSGFGQTGFAGAGIGGRPLQLTLSGLPVEGAPLIDLRITVDERTNSLIVAGSRNDLDIIEAIIARLEDSQVQQRLQEAVRLVHTQAADIANALNDFLAKSLVVLQKGNQLTAFQEIQRDVVIVPEPISNTLLISATPQYFHELIRLVHQLDTMPPQVVIQVLVAEVDLTDNQEFGVEIGLQSPVLFQRSVIPAPGFLGAGSISYANAAGGLVPPGVTVNNTINPTAQPGFNFNNPALGLGNNPVVNPSQVGFQGLGNLGMGRVSPTSNIGGFVFSAASDSFNLLVRALKTQGRIDILSRPQITTLDGQTALINVGQEIPIVTSSNVTATGIVQTNIDRRNVGVILQVTPRINPDGRVVMRVIPEISSVASQTVPLGNGNFGTSLNIQHLETTISAYDGETVALGGLINKIQNRNENKIPWFGDLPGVGALFRYRTQSKSKTELLIILTPHVVRSRSDMERVLAEESKRMDWILGDVLKVHGTTGMGPILGTPPMPAGPLELHTPMMVPGNPMPPELGPQPKELPKSEESKGPEVSRSSPKTVIQSQAIQPQAPGLPLPPGPPSNPLPLLPPPTTQAVDPRMNNLPPSVLRVPQGG